MGVYDGVWGAWGCMGVYGERRESLNLAYRKVSECFIRGCSLIQYLRC